MNQSRTPKRGHTLPEGAGSFYYAASSDRWVGTIEAGWTATGKRRRLTVSSRDENTAWQKLQAKRKQILVEGIPTQGKGGTMTVAAWCKKYLEVRKRDLKPKPWASERSAIQKWVIPTVGHRKLADLNAGDIRALGDAVEAVNSATHARYCQRTLQTYLRGAVAEGHTVPTAALTAKKFAARVSPREALPLVAAAKVLEAAHTRADHSRWDAAFLQGLRQGEALGLTWDSVDLHRGTITVAWTLQELTQNDAGGYTVPPQYEARQLWGRFWLLEPKSAAAKREIPMTPQFRASLEEWRRNCPDSPYGLVWPRPNGKPRIAADDRAEFVALQAAAEVAKADGSHYTVHEARHSTVSILLELGVAREVIERIVGHSELVEAYVSVSDARVVEALAALGNALHIEG